MNGTTPLLILLMKRLEAERPGDLQYYLERNSKRVENVVMLLGVFLSLPDGGPY